MSTQPSSSDPPAALPSTKSRLLRRIPGYLLLMVVVAVVMHYWRQQPNELEVVYHLGKKAAGLESLVVTYLRGEEVMSTVRFSYRVLPAKADQPHHVRLPEGDFEVSLRLGYRLEPSGADGKKTRTERIRRRILSRGSGKVRVFIADDS